MTKRQRAKKTLRYSDEFKVKAVEMSHQRGIKVCLVAEGLDIHPFMLSRWRKEYREGKFKSTQSRRMQVNKRSEAGEKSGARELDQLRREVERLRKENDLLKKWQRFLSEQRQTDSNSSKPTAKP